MNSGTTEFLVFSPILGRTIGLQRHQKHTLLFRLVDFCGNRRETGHLALQIEFVYVGTVVVPLLGSRRKEEVTSNTRERIRRSYEWSRKSRCHDGIMGTESEEENPQKKPTGKARLYHPIESELNQLLIFH